MFGKAIVLGLRTHRHWALPLMRHLDGRVRPLSAMDPATCRAERRREPVSELLPARPRLIAGALAVHRAGRKGKPGRPPHETR